MPRPISKVAPGWWDYTTLDRELLDDAARLSADDLASLAREGFQVHFYDTLEDFFTSEALEYVWAWRQATPDSPAGICGPIGPTEQLPLVARIVNALDLRLHDAHFWGMDEWIENGRPVPMSHPLSFAKADMELCFDRIRPDLAMPREQIHFPTDLEAYSASFEAVRCVVMQGGQGEVKHWAFNDPPRREGPWQDEPPPPAEYLRLKTRITDLHPMTVIQNARTSGGGYVPQVPTQAATVGPVETWRADRSGLRGHLRHVAAAGRAGVLDDRHRVKIGDSCLEAEILGGWRRLILPRSLAARRAVMQTSAHSQNSPAP